MSERSRLTEREIAALEQAKHLSRGNAEEIKAFRQGNNFYILFHELFRFQNDPQTFDDCFVLPSAMELGKVWDDFLEANKELLESIEEQLKKKHIVDELRAITTEYYVRGDIDGGDRFNQMIDPNSGYDVFLPPLWQELNPLLQEAADKMRQLGIDPVQFGFKGENEA